LEDRLLGYEGNFNAQIASINNIPVEQAEAQRAALEEFSRKAGKALVDYRYAIFDNNKATENQKRTADFMENKLQQIRTTYSIIQ
jgi:hypothetical protein